MRDGTISTSDVLTCRKRKGDEQTDTGMGAERGAPSPSASLSERKAERGADIRDGAWGMGGVAARGGGGSGGGGVGGGEQRPLGPQRPRVTSQPGMAGVGWMESRLGV